MASSGMKRLGLHPLASCKELAVQTVLKASQVLAERQGVSPTGLERLLPALMRSSSQPKYTRNGPDRGDLGVNCSLFAKTLRLKPDVITSSIVEILQSEPSEQLQQTFSRYEVDGMYVNFWYSSRVLSEIIPAIRSENYLSALEEGNGEKVMIEYSQPNTHKAFHVGHMRNVALGDSLVRLYEHLGNKVVAVNYFGDEGAHVAKCLWHLEAFMKTHKVQLEDLPLDKSEPRGEFLGTLYSEATVLLDLSSLTEYPFPGVQSGRVVSKTRHPAENAPDNWHVVEVQLSEETEDKAQVVCGGTDYEVGDIIGYIPVGSTFNRNEIVPKDMKGVLSSGMIVAYDELGLDPPKSAKPAKDKKTKSKVIFKLPPSSAVGVQLTELGRIEDESVLSKDVSVMEEFTSRKQQVGKMLARLEERESEALQLWQVTKEWSLSAFKDIYQWLDSRFDYDFYESQVGEESKQLVLEYLEKGVLVHSDGAVGADLSSQKLGFCLLLKSDGTGLYATKDLSLAHRKFTEFNIERSIYVVDAAQTLHFQQVFATLQLMGYENASKCYHLPYGQVRIPGGKMSSRKGNVIYFSALKETLGDQIYSDFLARNKGVWPDSEINEAQHALSVATIKYGMLNVDPSKDIVFEMSKWAAKSGETGVYLMYGYTRCKSILKKVSEPEGVEFDGALVCQSALERALLMKMNGFWAAVEESAHCYKPSAMCAYLFELTQLFMSWYEANSVKAAETPALQYSQLCLVQALASTLSTGMGLIGIKVIERM